MSIRRLWIALVFVVTVPWLAACALTLLFPALAMAADGRDDYLALGDSLAFGLDPFRPVADRSDARTNDLSLLVEQCAGDRACVTNGLPALLGTLERNLKTIYAGIRDDGHYRGRIVALTVYPMLLGNPPAPMPRYGDDDAVAVTDAVNRVVAAATTAAGGQVADGFGAFRAASGAVGEDPCAAGLLLRPSTPGQPCDLHPSVSGREALARTIQVLAVRDTSTVLPRAGELTIPVTMAIGLGVLLLVGGWALRRPGLSPRLLAMRRVGHSDRAPGAPGCHLLAMRVRRLWIALVLAATVPALACGGRISRCSRHQQGRSWPAMIEYLLLLVALLRATVRDRGGLVAENVLPRQHVAVLTRPTRRRPRLRGRDRLFWVLARLVRRNWRRRLVLVTPETVVRWHRRGWRRSRRSPFGHCTC